MKQALTWEERISRLEQMVSQLAGQSLVTSTAIANADSSTYRLCDGALVLTDKNGDAVALGAPNWFGIIPGAAFSAFDEDTGARIGTAGFQSDGTFWVQVCNASGEHFVLKLSETDAVMPAVKDTNLSSYSSVVVDSDGRMGIPVSDRSRKRQIEPIQGALAQVRKVQPVKFRWRDTGKPAVGFLNDELKETCGVGIHELISIVAILWQAVRELAEGRE